MKNLNNKVFSQSSLLNHNVYDNLILLKTDKNLCKDKQRLREDQKTNKFLKNFIFALYQSSTSIETSLYFFNIKIHKVLVFPPH